MQTKIDQLEAVLRELAPVAVAVSGGVDSMTLAVVAHRADPATQVFHAVSPAVPQAATGRVKRYADQEGWQLNIIDAGEMHDERYLNNPADRCYYCKTNLYDTVCEHTDLVVVSGTNQDDLGDYRPGLVAAEEHAVRHPYVDAGISKDDLRAIAKHLELTDLHDLPAAPCLSSRVATGIAIDSALLPVINQAEERLWESLQLMIPIKGVRCRIRHEQIAVEIESPIDIDADADYSREAIKVVESVFEAASQVVDRPIVVEPYKRGSAFLLDTLEVQ